MSLVLVVLLRWLGWTFVRHTHRLKAGQSQGGSQGERECSLNDELLCSELDCNAMKIRTESPPGFLIPSSENPSPLSKTDTSLSLVKRLCLPASEFDSPDVGRRFRESDRSVSDVLAVHLLPREQEVLRVGEAEEGVLGLQKR